MLICSYVPHLCCCTSNRLFHVSGFVEFKRYLPNMIRILVLPDVVPKIQTCSVDMSLLIFLSRPVNFEWVGIIYALVLQIKILKVCKVLQYFNCS